VPKGQRGVTLLSSRVKYAAMSEAVKETKFVYFLCKDIGILLHLPIVVKNDNSVVLFMSQNLSTDV
jgi:hypothetical protein